MNPKFSIIIVTYNALDALQRTISSVYKHSSDFELIIVDNKSDRPIINYLQTLDCKIIYNKKNLFWTKGLNIGIKHSTGQYVIGLNADIEIINPDWQKIFLDKFNITENIGIVGFDRRQSFQHINFHWIDGVVFAIKREVINKIGQLDGQNYPWWYSDLEYCYRAYKQGFAINGINEQEWNNIFLHQRQDVNGQQVGASEADLRSKGLRVPRTRFRADILLRDIGGFTKEELDNIYKYSFSQGKPEISVIISTYNRAKMLKRAIDSVLSQSFQNFELIIIDDCSTDKTEQVVKSYHSDKIIYYKNPTNSGHAPVPRNIGLSLAKGNYITFLDDDNFYYPEKLKKTWAYMQKHSCVDFVYCDAYQPNSKLKVRSIDFALQTLLQDNYIDTSEVLIRRKCFEQCGGFDIKLKSLEEWDLWVKMATKFQIHHIKEVLMEYILHAGSISRKIGKKRWRELIQIVRNRYRHLKESSEDLFYILIVTHNSGEKIKKCIEGIKLNTFRPYFLAIWDNGSTEETKKILLESRINKEIDLLILNEDNLGLPKAKNLLLSYLQKKYNPLYFIFMDHDWEITTKHWLGQFKAILDNNFGLIGAKLEEHKLFTKFKHTMKFQKDIYFPSDHIIGTCIGMTKNILSQAGYFNESYGKWGFDDLDMSTRIKELGYEIGYSNKIAGIHWRGNKAKFRDATLAKKEKQYKENIRKYKAKQNLYIKKPVAKFNYLFIVPPGEKNENNCNKFFYNLSEYLEFYNYNIKMMLDKQLNNKDLNYDLYYLYKVGTFPYTKRPALLNHMLSLIKQISAKKIYFLDNISLYNNVVAEIISYCDKVLVTNQELLNKIEHPNIVLVPEFINFNNILEYPIYKHENGLNKITTGSYTIEDMLRGMEFTKHFKMKDEI